MAHIIERPYMDDPNEEKKHPIDESAEFLRLIDICRREGYFVKHGTRIIGRNGKGEAVFFMDEDAMRKLYKDYEALKKLFLRDEERSGKQVFETEQFEVESGDDDAEKVYYEKVRDPFLSDPAPGEDKGQGH